MSGASYSSLGGIASRSSSPINSEAIEEIPILPPKSKTEKAAKITLLFVAIMVGFTISYSGTIDDWSEVKNVITNVGIILAYGMMGAFGLYMSGIYGGGDFIRNIRNSTFLQKTFEVFKLGLSIIAGAYAQLPYYEIGKEFRGIDWGLATFIGGLWTPAYSAYRGITELARMFKDSPHTTLKVREKFRRQLAAKLRRLYSKVQVNVRHAATSEHTTIFRDWTPALNQNSTSAVHTQVARLANGFFQSPIARHWLVHDLRRSFQVTALLTTSFNFWQNFILGRRSWQDFTSSPVLTNLSGVLANAPLSVYVLLGAWVSSGTIADIITDLLRLQRPKTFSEIHFPTTSQILRGLGLFVAAMPQYQTYLIADGTYKADTPFGAIFAGANVAITILFISIMIKELVGHVLLEAVDNGLTKNPAIEKARRLEIELDNLIEKTRKLPLETLCDMIRELPDEAARERFLSDIDMEKLREVVQMVPPREAMAV